MKVCLKTLMPAVLLALSGVAIAQDKPVDVRFTLEWKHQGHHALFYMAQQKGYFKDEGLNVRIDQGEGSAATVTRLMTGISDVGYGDINSAIEQAALHPKKAPVTVYMMQYKVPLAFYVKNTVKHIKGIEGLTIGTSPGSSAVRLFPAFAKANDIDASKVKFLSISPAMQDQMLAQNRVDGLLNFNATIYMNQKRFGRDPEKDYSSFDFYDHGLPLYGNGIMVSQDFVKKHPKAVSGLVKALNRAMQEHAQDIKGSAALMKKLDPILDENTEAQRTAFIFAKSYTSPEAVKYGFGDVDRERLGKTIDILTSAFALPRKPALEEVWDASYLPSKAERQITFATK